MTGAFNTTHWSLALDYPAVPACLPRQPGREVDAESGLIGRWALGVLARGGDDLVAPVA